MTADEVKALLPTGTYPDLLMLVQDIRRALLKRFPDCEKGERETRPFQAIPEPGKPLDAVMAFRPADDGKYYYIKIVGGKVDQVAEVEFRAAYFS
jgi:hypothetical protein